MTWPWRTTATPDGTWTTTCTHCGETRVSPNHSQIAVFQRDHECPPNPEGDAA